MRDKLVRDPIYKQVSEALLELIHSEYAVGDRFLSEREASERYAISRTTANKALGNLVVDGTLEFRKGIGTFVKRGSANVDLGRLVSFTSKAFAAGFSPETRLSAFRHTPVRSLRTLPPAKVSVLLGVSDRANVFEIERLRSLDGQPVILERRALLSDLCPSLKKEDVSGSLYALLSERFHLDIAGVQQWIRARCISGDDARLLNCVDGAPVLELTVIGYTGDGTAIWYETTLYRGDVYELVNTIGSTRQRTGSAESTKADEEHGLIPMITPAGRKA